MRTALLDAEMELQRAAVAAQSSRRSLQESTTYLCHICLCLSMSL